MNPRPRHARSESGQPVANKPDYFRTDEGRGFNLGRGLSSWFVALHCGPSVSKTRLPRPKLSQPPKGGLPEQTTSATPRPAIDSVKPRANARHCSMNLCLCSSASLSCRSFCSASNSCSRRSAAPGAALSNSRRIEGGSRWLGNATPSEGEFRPPSCISGRVCGWGSPLMSPVTVGSGSCPLGSGSMARPAGSSRSARFPLRTQP